MTFGSELEKRASPALAAELRRRNFGAIALGCVIGLAVVIDAFYARGHGGMVTLGRSGNSIVVPWWAAIAAGLFVLGLSLFALLRMRTRRF